MQEDSRSELRDLYSGALDEESRAHQMRFEGFGVRNGGVSGKEVGFPLERPDSRVSLVAGSNGGARYKSLSPARLPITARSPCLTIPPGLSPTTLLESPVFLTNVEAEPSPTTGSFSMASTMNDNAPSDTLSSPRDSTNNSAYDEGTSGNFEFKPHISLCSTSGPSSLGTSVSVGLKQQQCEPFVQDQSQCQTFASSCLIKPENTVVSSHDFTLSVTTPDPAVEIVTSRTNAHAEVASDELQQAKASENGIQASEIDHKENGPLVAVEKLSEDGYNWRKYGQKHVKGSEFPRSYYKCTHPNCQMKKQLERSHDGQIIEIVYKGKHDHPKPQPNRRLAVGAVLSNQGEERPNGFSSLRCAEDKSSNAQSLTSHNIDPNGALELSPVPASEDDVEGIGGRSNNASDDIVDDDDPESKRRKIDGGIVDVIPMGKPREPRVVVQTLSEVDILDDGYRWRKYGQKVVKGNPNPRSYYKCTNAGCPVRKHVERASHDPKAVITTYEGKHNHDVPAARNSSHDIAVPVIVNDAGCSSTMSGAMSGMLRTCHTTKTTSHQYEQSGESDTISLDLGVGISPRQDHRAKEKHQTPETEQIQNSQMHIAGSGCSRLVIQAAPISAYYVGSDNSMDCFGSREEKGESFSFKTAPLNHSSSPYQANMGRLLMGP